VDWFDNLFDGDLEFFGKFSVSLVVGGDYHDGACSITREDVICKPNGDYFVGKGVSCVDSRKNSCFVFGVLLSLDCSLGECLFSVLE